MPWSSWWNPQETSCIGLRRLRADPTFSHVSVLRLRQLLAALCTHGVEHTRTRGSRYFWFSLIAALLPPTASAETATLPRSPNIVVILADDMGYGDLGCYGQTAYTTPRLDRLAREGVRFTDFYVSQPICTASRVSLLTGAYANRLGVHGAFGLSTRHSIHPDETTLGELCQRAGYATAVFGKWGLGHLPAFSPLRHGFDEFYGILYSHDVWPRHPTKGAEFPDLPWIEGENVVGYNLDPARFTTDLTERTVDFIRRQHAATRPFFVFLAHPMPHVPLGVSAERSGASGAGLYGDVVQEIDWSAGRVLDTLAELGIDENTLVLFLSDNGPWLGYGDHAGRAEPFREGKLSVFEGGVRVPFIARWPGVLPAGRVVDAPAMAIDVFPTIAELLRLPPAAVDRPIDGRSLWPLLSGISEEPAQEAYFFYFAKNELQAMRSGPWKLVFPHTYRSIAGETPGRDGLPGEYTRNKTGLELYDMISDPGESRNVAAAYPEVIARLTVLAEQARADLGDALTGTIGTGRREPGHAPDS
jgi:arylsulfatase A